MKLSIFVNSLNNTEMSTLTQSNLKTNFHWFEGQRAEHQLLLLFCRTHLEKAQLAVALKLIQTGLDWPYLIEIAHRHYILPLIWQHLRTHFAAFVPQGVFQKLEQDFRANAYQNINFSRELSHIIQLMQTHAIPILAFKGPTLGELAYGDYSLRQFMDLDLLVHEAKVMQVKQILEKEGYESRYKLKDTQYTNYLRLGSEQDFWSRSKQIIIDLHWSILPKQFSFSSNPTALWENSQIVQLDEQAVRTLSLEDLLLFLCAHGAKHNWENLNQVCDIAELLRRHNFNWQQIQQNVAGIGNGTMLRLGLYLAHELLDAPLPVEIRNQVEADTRLPKLAAEAYTYMFTTRTPARNSSSDQPLLKLRYSYESYKNRIISWLKRDRVFLGCMEKWTDKLWFWSDVVIPTPLEILAVPLPNQLFFLYYGIRPLRLTLKYLSGKFRHNDFAE